MWDEFNSLCPNNDAAVEVWEWMGNFIPHITGMRLLIHTEINVNLS